MTSTVGPTPTAAHDAVQTAILADLTDASHKAVIVDSPPGAGKSTFVVKAAAQLAANDQVPIVAQTNAQADDLVAKLRTNHPALTIGRLTGSSYDGDLTPGNGLLVDTKLTALHNADVVIATGSKWGYVTDVSFAVGIIDEAYQMRSDQLLYVADLFPRAVLVGDPGQLDPFTPVDDSRWKAQPGGPGPVTPAVATVRHNHPDLVPHKLPVSWRLSARCAPLVAEAFYPHLPFRAGTTIEDRALTVGSPPADAGPAVAAALELAADTGWAHIELPARVCPTIDNEAVDTVARTALAALQAGIEAADTPGNDGPVVPERIAVGVAHRNQRSAVRLRLDELGRQADVDVSGITVDTANRLQGREFHLLVVLHPLSGRAAASEFHLETGRLCVLLSRHRHACIVVARAGISDVLDAYPMNRPVWIGADLPIPDGWEANQQVLDLLAPHRINQAGHRLPAPPPPERFTPPAPAPRPAPKAPAPASAPIVSEPADSPTPARPSEGDLDLVDPDVADLVRQSLAAGAPSFVAGAEHDGISLEAAWPEHRVAVLCNDDDDLSVEGWDARPAADWTIESLLAALGETD